ncbi:MAG: IS630 family transposase, partial [Burkholderiaceae bacterium]
KLSANERIELQRQANARNGRADSARHARLILLLAEGLTWAQIRATLDCADSYISCWSRRFEKERLAGLCSRHKGRTRYKVTDRLEARILAWTTARKPADGSTQWSSRKLARELGADVSHMTVTRIWAKHGLKPHRLEGRMSSKGLDFETRAADVIGLYLNSPQHAAVFCIEAKTAIQAHGRKDPLLPLSPGGAKRRGVHSYRHGSLSLCAAFDTRSGEVPGKTAARHASTEFVAFLTDIAAPRPRGREIHVIADNLSAHKTKALAQFIADHPSVHLHFTPTCSSWLDQVESWFARIERDVLARGVLTSVADLKRKLMRYIRRYSKQAKPVQWKLLDPPRPITPDSTVTTRPVSRSVADRNRASR